ncbi:tyrosine-type recombinase/integrase [Candidatus Woesearchaeota archaeon]|nr:tyrosine-type recombinase/integrase [Candidatus Woesearchaeota archaeon]
METKRLDIYPGRSKSFDFELARLRESKISARNKELIIEFQNYLFSTGTNSYRVGKLTGQLKRLCEVLGKDLDIALRKDIMDLIAQYNRLQTLSEATKADYRRCIKQFYKWFEEEDKRVSSPNDNIREETKKLYCFLRKEVKIAYKAKQVDSSAIITDDDLDLVIERGCRTIKEKALIKLLHETGVRAGELLNMKLGDIEIRDNYGVVKVDGKTGRREVPVVTSLPYLVQWLDLHPFKGSNHAYLWTGENRAHLYKPLLHRGVQKLVDKCFERAGLLKCEYAEIRLESGKTIRKVVKRSFVKKTNLHWFRHSRASLLAPYLTESLLCKYMGWTLGSKQIRTYVHLCTKQLESAVLSLRGINTAEEKPQSQPIKCICDTINTPTARYCYKCGKPLSMAIVAQDSEIIKEETDKTIKLLLEIANNPELLKKFEDFKKTKSG